MTCPISIVASNSSMQALLLIGLLSDAFYVSTSGLLPIKLKNSSSLYKLLSTILKYFELNAKNSEPPEAMTKKIEHLSSF